MEATLKEFLNHVPVFLRRPDGEILYWTEGCCDLFGYSRDEAVGRLAHELLGTAFPEDRKAVEAKLRAEGEWTGRLRQTAKNGRSIWTITVLRFRERSGGAGPVVVEQSTDISSRVELEEQRDLLTRELEHRVKNLLSVVQSLARSSFIDAHPEQLDKFENRLAALSEANQVLREGSWNEADLRKLIREVAGALGVDDRLQLDGPQATIRSDQATGFALALHELCTNALKHGALAVETGRVRVRWDIEPDGRHLSIRWEERGGPAPAVQRRAGFGTRLIQKAIPGSSPVALHFGIEGVSCTMRLSLGAATWNPERLASAI